MICKIFSFEKSIFRNETQSFIFKKCAFKKKKKKNIIRKWIAKLTLIYRENSISICSKPLKLHTP